jgi:exodeoxyribonuclease-3
MKIVSWNVNGIRSIYNKGFLEWFTKESPDILCLQEIKAFREQFPSELLNLKNYQVEIASAKKAGYSGVATFSKEKILDTEILNLKKFDDEGRTLIHHFNKFILVNCYFPNGQRDHARVKFKLEYCERIYDKIESLKKILPVILVGDFNTAHHEIDLANPKNNLNTTGFLPQERAFLDKYFQTSMIDGFRHLHPNQKEYTWWTYRHNCRERNIGWRLDYMSFSPNIIKKIKSLTHLHDVRGSDHCPVRGVLL